MPLLLALFPILADFQLDFQMLACYHTHLHELFLKTGFFLSIKVLRNIKKEFKEMQCQTSPYTTLYLSYKVSTTNMQMASLASSAAKTIINNNNNPSFSFSLLSLFCLHLVDNGTFFFIATLTTHIQ